MKQFHILDSAFRFSTNDFEKIKYKHGACFDTILDITQLKLMIGGEKLFRAPKFDVRYYMGEQLPQREQKSITGIKLDRKEPKKKKKRVVV